MRDGDGLVGVQRKRADGDPLVGDVRQELALGAGELAVVRQHERRMVGRLQVGDRVAVRPEREDGGPITDLEPPDHPAFVLSDHRPFTGAEGDLLADVADERVAVGPLPLHADQTITVAHNYLDTAG